MTREQILTQLRTTLVETFELDPSAVVPEASLFDDLDLDSIDAIDMAVRTKPLAGRKMSDDELRSLRTVGDVVELIVRMRAERAAS